MGVPSKPAAPRDSTIPDPPAYPWPPMVSRHTSLPNVAILFTGRSPSEQVMLEQVRQLLASSSYRDRVCTSELNDNIGVSIRLRSQLTPFPRLEMPTVVINDQPRAKPPSFPFPVVVCLTPDELDEQLIALITELLPY